VTPQAVYHSVWLEGLPLHQDIVVCGCPGGGTNEVMAALGVAVGSDAVLLAPIKLIDPRIELRVSYRGEDHCRAPP
jgi:hypothetical protein